MLLELAQLLARGAMPAGIVLGQVGLAGSVMLGDGAVLGDARTNGRPPRDDVFAAITARAGRTFWLNPEPRLYWNYGDSVISAYEQYCHAYECWTTQQLEDFVKDLTKPMA